MQKYMHCLRMHSSHLIAQINNSPEQYLGLHDGSRRPKAGQAQVSGCFALPSQVQVNSMSSNVWYQY